VLLLRQKTDDVSQGLCQANKPPVSFVCSELL
jgi:hypothetical protein